tara:strand:+ start:42 stop:233 length:192 start_codon:yes stop_codon:yes gene_type:complete
MTYTIEHKESGFKHSFDNIRKLGSFLNINPEYFKHKAYNMAYNFLEKADITKKEGFTITIKNE